MASGFCLGQSHVAQQGILDLRGHDWAMQPSVALIGEWEFDWQRLDDAPDSAPKMLISVPGSWNDGSPGRSDHGFGTYRLRILLGDGAPTGLAIRIEEFLTAYTLKVNGVALGGVGTVGRDAASSSPAIAPEIYILPTAAADTLDIALQGSNFHHRQGGMAQPPLLGVHSALIHDKQSQTILGGILIGLLLMSSAYQFMHYFQRRQEPTILLTGMLTLVSAFHYLLLHERFLYGLLGENSWSLGYRLELASLFVIFVLSFEFLYLHFQKLMPHWLRLSLLALLTGQILFVLFMPIALAAQVDRIFPVEFTVFLLIVAVLQGFALCRRAAGAVPIAVATAGFILSAIAYRLLFGLHVGSLLPVHYFFGAYVFTFSWILSRRAAATERAVYRLSIDLERSNNALEAQNQSLEAEVQQRTAELVQAQQASHELEMDQVKRDIEALSTTNQMKMQLTRNLMEELQALLNAGGDYQAALKSMMSGLRGQIATEERLEVLQEDLALVNAEFYRRLQSKYPQLSKTEREICAYMKLNLSGKDIAQLRKTSINTINVARHRIRKKLGLERDEELEAVIQQL